MIGPYTVGDRPVESLAIDVTSGGVSTALSDFTGASATLHKPSGIITTLDAFIEDDDVVVAWPEDSSAFTEVGAYVLSVTLTGPENSTAITPLGFVVLAAQAGSWASVGDVVDITGKSVTPELIRQAQGIIEVSARVSSDQSYFYNATPVEGQTIRLSPADSKWLRMAVAYQAAWMQSQPDLFDRADVTSIGQDGVSANFTGTGLTLSPHAKNAIKRLSWMSSRSVNLARSRSVNLVEAIDDSLPWKKL